MKHDSTAEIAATMPQIWRLMIARTLLDVGDPRFGQGGGEEPCPACGGQGYKWNGSRLVPVVCPLCHGMLEVPGAVAEWFEDEALARHLRFQHTRLRRAHLAVDDPVDDGEHYEPIRHHLPRMARGDRLLALIA